VRIYAADFGGVECFEVEMFRGFPPVQYGPSCTNACRPLSSFQLTWNNMTEESSLRKVAWEM